MIIKTSTTLPWWTRGNENRPDLTVLTNFKNSMKDDNIKINWIDDMTITTVLNKNPVIDDNAIKYIYVEKENSIANYYYFSKLTKIANNKYICTFTLDVYCTYTINFIYRNWEKKLTLMRTHKYSPECLMYDDEKIDNIPKFYDAVTFQRKEYNYDVNNQMWYGMNNIGIRGNDLVNANRYFVFKDGINGGYKFFPIISKYFNSEIYLKEPVITSKKLIDTITFRNGRYKDGIADKVDEDTPEPSKDGQLKAYWEQNKLIEYYYQKFKYEYRFPAHTVLFDKWVKIDYVPFGTLPKHLKAESAVDTYWGAGLREIWINYYLLGNEIYKLDSWNITSGEFQQIGMVADNCRIFKAKVYDVDYEYHRYELKNSLEGLETLRKNENYINKFLGVYYLPNILSFKHINFEDIKEDNGNTGIPNKINKYAYININPLEGEKIFLNVYKYGLNNLPSYFNNPNYSNDYLLKYLDIKYYGNAIKAEFRVNETQNIFIDGSLFFTDVATIVAKSSNLISLGESIFSYPYMLPYGTSEYEKYLSANRGVTETGFNIAKRQQEISVAKLGVDIGLGVMNIASDAAMDVATGGMGQFESIGKAIPYNGRTLTGTMQDAYVKTSDGLSSEEQGAIGGNAATKLLGLAAKSAFTAVNQINSMQNMIDKNTANYRQAKQLKGNNINFSSIDTAAMQFYYNNDDGSQYEGVEVKNLTPATLALINNTLLLYGYFLPEITTIKSRLERDENFSFIQIDNLTLNELINIDSNLIENNSIYGLIKAELSNGVRIWKKDNTHIPSWTPELSNPNGDENNDLITSLPPVNNDNNVVLNVELDVKELIQNYKHSYSNEKIPFLFMISQGKGINFDLSENETYIGYYDKNNKQFYKNLNFNPDNLIKVETININLPNLTNIKWTKQHKVLSFIHIYNILTNKLDYTNLKTININTPNYVLPEDIKLLYLFTFTYPLKPDKLPKLIWNGKQVELQDITLEEV